MARPVFISDDVAKRVLRWPEMIAALRHVYSVEHPPFAGPPRVIARGPRIWMRTLTGVLPSGTVMGTKQFCFPRSKHVQYMITLFDQESGELLGLCDASTITALRTGATTAVAIDKMAGSAKLRIAMLGSGAEARSHARAIAAVRPVEWLQVFSPSAERRGAYAKGLEAELGFPCRPVASAKEAVAGANLVVGASRTTDGKPVLEGAWLEPGVLVASIGATLPDHHEIDPKAIDMAELIVADMPEEVIEETGCFADAHKAGVAFEDKFVTLNDLMLGRADDRLRAARHPMFRSVGHSLQDLAVAELALREAKRQGLAVELPMQLAKKSD
jgi:ornithine cyclodeaminase/alanine dehydrogenase